YPQPAVDLPSGRAVVAHAGARFRAWTLAPPAPSLDRPRRARLATATFFSDTSRFRHCGDTLPLVISLQDIEQARERIGEVVKQTPCLPSRTFSDELGVQACFKYETLQHSGSFKVRGAFNKISSLSRCEVERGVITASAGNHAQGVAFSASQAGVAATIVMPKMTPLIKIENTRRLGGRVVLAGDIFDEACDEARRREAEHGLVFVHPFDDE